jgi:hypothetical protein
MDEKTVSELISELQTVPLEFEFVYAKLLQCRQAIEWAKQLQRWDLVIEIASVCSYNTKDLNSFSGRNEPQGKILTEEEKRNFCQQLRVLAVEGLTAARQKGNQNREYGFLIALVRLSDYLDDFDRSLNYLRELRSIPGKSNLVVGEKALQIGHKANSVRDYVAARNLYQFCLDIVVNEVGNKGGEANILDFMAANEFDAGNFSLAQELSDRVQQIRRQ